MGMTDSGDRDGYPGGMGKIETRNDTRDLEGQGGTAGSQDRGGNEGLAGWGGAGESTDQGNAGGKMKSDGARGMEG